MIVDAHAHLFHLRWYPRPFQEALVRDFTRRQSEAGRRVDRTKSSQRLFRLLTDATGETTLRVMDRVGIDKRVILVVDWGLALGEAEKSIREIHSEILAICARWPDRFVGFAGIDPRRTDAVDVVQWAFDELGAQGLKLHPTSDWRLDEEGTHRVVAVAAERGAPVLVHVGKTVDVLSDSNSQPRALQELARAFPQTRFIAGHSGFGSWSAFAAAPDVPPNILFDISGWQELTAGDPTRLAYHLSGLLEAFPGRVCFGTDAPFYSYNLATAESQWLRMIQDYLASSSVAAAGVLNNPLLLDAPRISSR